MAKSAEEIRVLHVDDEPSFADLAGAFLEEADDRIAVHTETSAADGLAYLESNEVECVISDYEMPGRNGVEFLSSVRRRDQDLPFILYTGRGSEEVASDAISAGATDYLQKGSGTDQYELLANRVLNAVSQYRSGRAQQRLVELAEHTDRVLFSFTADWSDVLFVSTAYEEVWGRPIEDLREEPTDFLAGIHPEDRDRVRAAMDRASQGETVDIEFRVNAEESWGRWVRVQVNPILDETGSPVRVAGFAADITDVHRRRERRERQRETLVDLSTDEAVTEGDFETAVRRITETAAAVLEVPRVNVWLVEEDDGDEVLTCVDHFDRGSDDHTAGMELRPKEYPSYFAALESNPAIGADDAHEDPRTAELEAYLDANDIGALLDGTLRSGGEVIGVVCHEHVGDARAWTDDEIDFASNIADIVHRALRNKERREREQTLELRTRAMDEAPVGITLADATESDLPMVYVNEGFEKITGYTETEALGRNCRFLQGERTDPETVATMREAIENAEPVTVELTNYRKDGTPFWNRVSISPVFDDGHLTHFVGSQQDISDLKDGP